MEILERRKKDEPYDLIAEAMGQEQSQVKYLKNIFYRSTHLNVLDYLAKKKIKGLTKEEKVKIVLELLERLKKDELFDLIAEVMGQEQPQLKNLFYQSTHLDVPDYKAKESRIKGSRGATEGGESREERLKEEEEEG